jgi:hypothetical protein
MQYIECVEGDIGMCLHVRQFHHGDIRVDATVEPWPYIARAIAGQLPELNVKCNELVDWLDQHCGGRSGWCFKLFSEVPDTVRSADQSLFYFGFQRRDHAMLFKLRFG